MSKTDAMKVAFLHAALKAKTARCHWQKEHDKLDALQLEHQQLIEHHTKCKETSNTYQNSSLLLQEKNYLKMLDQQITEEKKQMIDASSSEQQLHQQWLKRLTKAKALAKILSNIED